MGFAGSGDEVEPAAGDEGVFVEAEDAVGDRIAVVVVVEEPAIELVFADGELELIKVHGDPDSLRIVVEMGRELARGKKSCPGG